MDVARSHAIKAVDKIIQDKKTPSPKNFALASAWILADFKGINLKILDMQKTSSLADYYVLASAENTTTARAMAESIQFHMKRHNLPAQSVEGIENAQWILLDCGDIIVHVFQEAIRSVFDLDDLWRENPAVPIPQEYYFSRQEDTIIEEKSSDYF